MSRHVAVGRNSCLVYSVDVSSQARNYISSLPHMPKRSFADVFIGANPLGNAKENLVFPYDLQSLHKETMGLSVIQSCLHADAFLSCGSSGENAGSGYG